MIISIHDAVRQTTVVSTALFIAILLSIRRTKNNSLFPLETSNELKGLAVLMIVLSHIGYFLVSDHRFLIPLSNYAGVGVDLFLILSGYGLVISAIEKPLTILQFYRRRLLRIYIPLISVLVLLLITDFLFLHQSYPLKLTFLNLLGIFPEANLYTNIDSPLWYITFMLMLYAIFPLLFRRRFPLLSSIEVGLAAWYLVKILPYQSLLPLDRISFYKLHFLSFPVGMAFAALVYKYADKLEDFFSSKVNLRLIAKVCLAFFAGWILEYTFHHSHVGETWYRESLTSIYSALAVVVLFILKPFRVRLLEIFGAYSFEIYLLHWPLVWRYNFLYGRIPEGYATVIYLVIFLAAGYFFQTLVKYISNLKINVKFSRGELKKI